MDLDALRHGNFNDLDTAVTDWDQMVDKLKKLQSRAETELDGKSLKANWEGVNATVTREFITKTSREFGQAVTEATSIRNILRDTYNELVHYQTQLKGALNRAIEKNIHVFDKGEGKFTVEALSMADPKKEVPQGKVDAVKTEVQAILSKATNSDNSAAQALRGLVDLAQVGFSSAPVIDDRDSAGAALKREQIRQRGIKLAAEYRRNTKWPFAWGLNGTHPRGRDAESKRTDVHWAERDLMKQRPWEAAKWGDISYWALKKTQEESQKNPNLDEGALNAFRHAIWQARLTDEMGSESAKRWADAHEAYYPKSELPDHMADLVNNEYGRQLGEQVQKEVPYVPPGRGDPGSGERRQEYILNEARRFAQSDQAAKHNYFHD
jgi:hypothetical protein